MSDDGNVLPQAKIDAMFNKQATDKNGAPPSPTDSAAPSLTDSAPPPPTDSAVSSLTDSAAPSETDQPSTSQVITDTNPPQDEETLAPSDGDEVQPLVSPPSDEFLTMTQAVVADIAQRVAKVETNFSRLSQKERENADVGILAQQLSQRFETLAKELQKVKSQLSGVLRGLDGTPGYNIRHEFTCRSCGSPGLAAIPMRCTNCGSEGWWGWWPKEK